MNIPALTTFDLYQISGAAKARQVAINPLKVSAVRETVHGSVILTYPGKTQFELAGPLSEVVSRINQARH